MQFHTCEKADQQADQHYCGGVVSAVPHVGERVQCLHPCGPVNKKIFGQKTASTFFTDSEKNTFIKYSQRAQNLVMQLILFDFISSSIILNA